MQTKRFFQTSTKSDNLVINAVVVTLSVVKAFILLSSYRSCSRREGYFELHKYIVYTIDNDLYLTSVEQVVTRRQR